MTSPIVTLDDFLGRYYRAKVLSQEPVAKVTAAFADAAELSPALIDEAKAKLAEIAATGLSDSDLRQRDFILSVSREGLLLVVP
jgi:hypothetical protein